MKRLLPFTKKAQKDLDELGQMVTQTEEAPISFLRQPKIIAFRVAVCRIMSALLAAQPLKLEQLIQLIQILISY